MPCFCSNFEVYFEVQGPDLNTTTIVLEPASFTVLPIELLSFEAIAAGRSIDLTWSTASELNNDFFTVERSNDGQNWEELAYIDGAGNATSQIDYKWSDASPLNGVSYYRLKQTDFDGQFSYSDIRAITVSSQDNLTVYPNPAKDKLTVKFANADTETLNVFDLSGRNMKNLIGFLAQNDTTCLLDISQLPAGVYFVSNNDETVKLVKQ